MSALRTLLLAAACLLTAPLALADNAVERGLIRVGTAADYPPLTQQSDGKVSGIEADLAAQMSQRTDLDFEFRILPWNELLPALERGDIDMVMSGMSVTPERAAKVDFTEPYFQIGQMAIIRSVDAGRFNSPMQLLQPGVRIGYVADTTGAAFVRKFASMTEIRSFPSVEPALAALMAGEIDCLVHDSATSWNVDKDRRFASLMSLHRPLTKENLAWAVNKQQPALLALLNQQLQQMRSDGSLQRVLNQWIPVRVTME